MNVIETKLPGVLLFEPNVFADERGYFFENFSQQRYSDAGLVSVFVQDNVSFSKKGVLRGLHFQYPNSQGKLVGVISGEVVDVAVDIRVGSPTFGKWVAETLSEANHRQMYIPPGFAHGFCVVSETAFFSYKCTSYYDSSKEGSIIFNDPDIGIDWGVKEPELSPKDANAPLLKDIQQKKLPRFEDNQI